MLRIKIIEPAKHMCQIFHKIMILALSRLRQKESFPELEKARLCL